MSLATVLVGLACLGLFVLLALGLARAAGAQPPSLTPHPKDPPC